MPTIVLLMVNVFVSYVFNQVTPLQTHGAGDVTNVQSNYKYMREEMQK